MFYRIIDKRDEYTATAYTKEEAITNAINHCIIEGLQVLSFSDIENCPLIVYVDPDDYSAQDISIYPIEV